MLCKLELLLSYEYTEKLTYHISSAMHGILMELMEEEYGDFLHQNNLKPFHQYVSELTEKTFKWTICTLDETAWRQIIERVINKEEFLLKHKSIKLKVIQRRLMQTTYDEMIEKLYFGEHSRDIHIQFLSPISFKQKGHYVFMPDIRLIFQSLMMKYDSYSKQSELFDETVLEQITEYVYIKKYHLKSVRYALERTWINAFLGEITIHINGPGQLVNLIHLLAAYGEYSGVGIKCSLGMGAIRITG